MNKSNTGYRSAAIKRLCPVLSGAARIVFSTLAAALVLSALSCNKDQGPKETPKERATREIIASLLLPPDSALRGTEVKSDMDTLVLNYGTNMDMDVLAKYFKQKVMEKKYTLIMENESGISYQDNSNRHVTVMWFAHDPDLSEFKIIFHVAVNPLPPELKETPK